jgi:hypothetical protein
MQPKRSAKARKRDELCVEEFERRWRRAIEWYGDDTLQNVRERAVKMAYGSRRMRDLWVKSVQRTRDARLLDRTLAMGIIHDIIIEYMRSQDEDDDPILCDVCRRMDAWLEVYVDPQQVERRNRKAADEWQALCDEHNRRADEMLVQVLREVGENQMAIALVEDEDYYMDLIEEADWEIREDDREAGEVRGRGVVGEEA